MEDNFKLISNIGELNSILEKPNQMIVIDFFATWCKTCNTISEYYFKLSELYNGIIFLKINIEDIEDIKETYNVEKLPTFIVLKDKEELLRLQGASKINDLKSFLNSQISLELDEDF
jgi:thiol-disulfide isomerase/thioredoxin